MVMDALLAFLSASASTWLADTFNASFGILAFADTAYSFSVGMLATFNPCGFALLPAYLAYFVGLESAQERNPAYNILRGLIVGLTLSLGFLLVFGVIGGLTSTLISQSTVYEYLRWAILVIGILLIPLGIAMLAGFELKLSLPRLSKGGTSRQLPSMFLFGVSFAIVSLGCTAPLFFGAVANSFTNEGIWDGTLVFLAYGAGMSVVVMVLTMATAMSRTEIAVAMRKILPYVNKISGAFLILAGAFLLAYGWWEVQTLRHGEKVAARLQQASEQSEVLTDSWMRHLLDAEVLGEIKWSIQQWLLRDLELVYTPYWMIEWLVEQSLNFQANISDWIGGIGQLRLGVTLLLLLALPLGLVVWDIIMHGKPADRVMSKRRWYWMIWVPIWLHELLVLEAFHYGFELLVLPVWRTIVDIPFRIGGWFSEPGRWAVLFEVMAAFIVAFFAWLRIKQLKMRRQSDGGGSDPDDPTDTGLPTDTAPVASAAAVS